MSIPFSDMTGANLSPRHLGTDRRNRPERLRWVRNAIEIDADGRPYDDRFTDLPYLVAHPEREIAEIVMWNNTTPRAECAACGHEILTGLTDAPKAIAAAHAHNAARHPRRWLRSQHGQVDSSVALDEARRVTSWGTDA